MSTAIDMNSICERFAEAAADDQLSADDFFDWADKGEASALLHDIIADDDQHYLLQLIIRAGLKSDLQGLAKPAIDRLYAHAYEYKQKELAK